MTTRSRSEASQQRATIEVETRKRARYYRCEAWGISPLTGTEWWPSVTTILGVLARPALTAWLARTARDEALAAAQAVYAEHIGRSVPLAPETYVAAIRERLPREPGTQARDAAASHGHALHAWIQWQLGHADPRRARNEPRLDGPARSAAVHWLDWWAARPRDWRVLAVEQVVAHPTLGYAGTADLIVQTSNGPLVIDWKTSRAIYPEYGLQLAAYAEAVTASTGPRITRGQIVHVPLEGAIVAHEMPSRLTVGPVWRACLRLWAWAEAARTS